VIAVEYRQSFDLGEVQLTCLGLGESFSRDQSPPVRRLRPDGFHVIVGHSPDFALGQIDADLLVAGHTHGGQARLPWLGAITTGCKIPRTWAAGLTELPSGAKLLVSRGIGMERGNAPPIRFLCRPELAVIELAPAPRRAVSRDRSTRQAGARPLSSADAKIGTASRPQAKGKSP
jgi:predicted MPP superfamily phosphohydrolase